MREKNGKSYEKEMAYASLGKRAFAFLLDWYLGSVFSAIPVGFFWKKLTGEMEINTDITLFEEPYGYLAGALGLLFGVLYFYIVPAYVWDGQTFAKRLMRIKMVDENGGKLAKSHIALRQIVGILFLEGAYMLTGNYIVGMVSMATTDTVGRMLSYLMVMLFMGSVVLTVKSRKAIHDYMAHSIVIEKE